jgi:hydrogenase expression/formation protein HypC
VCLAIPLLVISVQGSLATVEMGGISREISLILTPEAQAGNYVLVHTGFAISVLDEAEAQETLALFAELEEAEKQTDEAATRQHQP